MKELSVVIFTISALIPVIGAYRDRDRIYQLPFLFSMAVFVYILPTLYGILGSKALVSDEAYIKYCLFSTVCFWMSLIGYWSFYNHTELKQKYIYAYDLDKWSLFLYIIMLIAFGAIISMSGYAVSERYGGSYAVILFPARCLRPATIILFIIYLIKPSRDKLFFLILSVLFSLKIIVIDGRRSEVFNLFITFAFPLFFIKGIRAPCKYIAPAIVGAIIIFTFLPAYRNYTLKGNFGGVLNISPGELLASYVSGGSTNEVIRIYDAAKNVDVADQSGDYNYGSTAYNQFVSQYASSLFFGKDFKQSLMIPTNLDLNKLRDKDAKYAGEEYKNYLAPTGFAAVFFEFGYAGCLLFFFFGLLTKKYYQRAIIKNDLSKVMFYCFFATFILFSIYDSMLAIPTMIVLYLLVFWGGKRFSRLKSTRFIVNQI